MKLSVQKNLKSNLVLVLVFKSKALYRKSVDQFRFPGNCPPTPPLSHHFILSEKYVVILA